jgi:integrase
MVSYELNYRPMVDLTRKRERERLAVRADAYWQRLSEGAYLGFRRGPDTWHARYRDRSSKQHYHPLGEALEFDEAKRRAEGWIGQLAKTAVRSVKRATVRAALQTYLADLRRHGRSGAAEEATWRFKAVIFDLDNPKKDDVLAGMELESITQDDLLEWRERLVPGRQPRTVNRYVRAVVAGLNRAHQLGHVGNPSTWRLTPLSDDVEDDGETAVFLNARQRKDLIAAASPEAAAYLRGLDLTGARPKELAEAKVGDFDGETIRLAHRKGRPPRLRVRHTVLDKDGVEHFARAAKNKKPGEYLFTEDGEQPWRRHMWSRHIRKAISKHNENVKEGSVELPTAASAYSFRHARISEMLQLHGIDPLTVAAQTGTSLPMIERSYLRFIPSAMREKLAAIKGVPM